MARNATVLLLVTIAGCAATAAQHGRSHVAAELERRTGATLATESEGEVALPPGVALDDGLTEDEAVTLALWNNAAFQETLAELGFTRAELVQAGLLTNPEFSMLFPLGPKQLEFTAILPLEALWLRPRRIALAEADAARIVERLVQSGLDLVRDARVAFAEVERAERRARLADEAVQLSGRLAEVAEARLRAGDASALEISTARVDAQRSREDFARLKHEVRLARAQLRALLGLLLTDGEFTIEFPAATQTRSVSEAREVAASDEVELHAQATTESFDDAALDVDTLIHDALAARPDLRAAEMNIDAACKRAGLSKLDYLTFAGIADANGRGTKGFEMGPGLLVRLPIFHRNNGAVARADADVERAVRQLNTVHDRIVLEVREAHTRFEQANEQLRTWRSDILPTTEDAVRQAQSAFENGDAPLVTVLEATRQLLDARVRRVEAEAARRRAWAELERSVGQRITHEVPAGPRLEQTAPDGAAGDAVLGTSDRNTGSVQKTMLGSRDGWTSSRARGATDQTRQRAPRDFVTASASSGDADTTEDRP